MDDIELPIPDSLFRLKVEAEQIKMNSLPVICDHPEWHSHLRILGESITLIRRIAFERRHKNENELILRAIGARLYNNFSVSWNLILSGFHQISIMPLRDMLECSFLLLKFAFDSEAIPRWKYATTKEQKKEFRPLTIRNFLKKSGEITPEEKDNMDSLYHIFCELGAHPTYKGINKMLGRETKSKRSIYLGPFLDSEKLGISLTRLTFTVSLTVRSLVTAFGLENLRGDLHLSCIKFFADSDLWIESAYKPNPNKNK